MQNICFKRSYSLAEPSSSDVFLYNFNVKSCNVALYNN